MAVSENRGTPKSSILTGFFHYKPSILVYHYFWKHPHEVMFYLRITESTGVSSFKAPASIPRFHVHLWKGIHTFLGGKLTKNGNNLGTLSGIWRWQVFSRNTFFQKKGCHQEEFTGCLRPWSVRHKKAWTARGRGLTLLLGCCENYRLSKAAKIERMWCELGWL